MKQFYSKFCLIFISFLFFSISISAQGGNNLWTKTTKESLSKTQKIIRKTEPTKASFYKLDINGLKSILQNAPKRNGFTGTSNVIVDFPNSDGHLEAYRVLEAPVMEETLQLQHPNIRTYVGQSIENPSMLIRFSITPQGLHTMILSSNKGTQFMDPYIKDDNSYIIYAKQDLPSLKDNFICEVINDISTNKNKNFNLEEARNANDGKLRDFRLALASTIEYSEFHWMAAGLTVGDTEADKKDAVHAAMVVTMNRVNFIFERELSITMTLIGNNRDIIFIDSDSFNNNNPSVLIGQSQSVIDSNIGDTNYDIGHTFSTGGGGVAFLAVPCVNGSKASGITGSSAPVGDAYDIDFVAHEMGHQFGANHTFNGTAGNCSGTNRNASTAYEPGSGTTIMAYAGICTPQNVENNSDAYFHQASLAEIWANVTTGNSQCGEETSNGNASPTAMAGADYTIPISTPYKLTGSSTDTDGTGSHTFTWEQYDLGDAGLPTEGDLSGGPLVRSFEGTTNPIRYIPRLLDILNNGGISTTWEKLASVNRTINFELTVRDNGMTGGQTDSDGMVATTVNTAGPFLVTSQASMGISWAQNTTETITWDVAGTTTNGIDTANVKILLSTDGGVNFDTVLAASTPNDGTHDITVPNIMAGFCRIMVEGVNNIFFNINTVDFAIGYTITNTCTTYNSTDSNLPITITDDGQDFTETSALNIPTSLTITDVNFTVDITHTWPGDLLLGLQSPNNTLINIMEPYNPCQNEDTDVITTFDDDGIAFDCNTTGDGLTMQSPISSLSGWNGEDASGVWVLGVGDFGAADVGTLNGWSVEICYDILIPLGTEEFDQIHFTVYPNPNNGEFTVKLSSNSGNNIAINVYDIRGRRVFNNSYNNASNFNEDINLGNVQSGIYLLNVSDGIKSTTKKIIVN